jgi:hypothetical protein
MIFLVVEQTNSHWTRVVQRGQDNDTGVFEEFVHLEDDHPNQREKETKLRREIVAVAIFAGCGGLRFFVAVHMEGNHFENRGSG